jgi:hypothetical protein
MLCVTDKIQLLFGSDDIHVYEGHKSIQWFVNVTSASKPVLVWYGPDCKVLEEIDGPSSYKVYMSPDGTSTKLKLSDISLKDRGVYRLQARSKEDEEWAYFTLNVKSKETWLFEILICFIATVWLLICCLILLYFRLTFSPFLSNFRKL